MVKKRNSEFQQSMSTKQVKYFHLIYSTLEINNEIIQLNLMQAQNYSFPFHNNTAYI